MCVCVHAVRAYVRACVCVLERERERESERGGREGGREVHCPIATVAVLCCKWLV